MMRDDGKTIPKGWYYIYPLLFGMAFAQKAIFTENQNTKFITGLSLAKYGDIASDWMAGITDPFPVFSHLLKWQYESLGLYAGVHLSFLLLAGLYSLFSIWLAKTLVPKGQGQPKTLLVFSFLWLLIHTEGLRQLWGHFFPDGLAYQYLLGEYYQPCCFGVFLIGGIAAFQSRQFILSWICLIMAPLFHPAYLFVSSVLALSMVLISFHAQPDVSWKKRAGFLLLVFMVLIPLAQWNVSTLSSGTPVIQDNAYQILKEICIPHHSLPSHWSLRLTLQFFIVGFAAAWMEKKHLVGQVLFVLLSIAALSSVFNMMIQNPALVALAPWRVSVLAAPVSWMILVTKTAKWISGKIQKRRDFLFQRLKVRAMILIFIACLVGSMETYFNYQDKTKRPDYLISGFLAKHHEPKNLYLIPPELKNLRLEAGVPVFVTAKSNPTKDQEFLAWYERLKTAEELYRYPATRKPSETARLLRDNTLTHILWPESQGLFPYEAIGHNVYTDKHFSLWDVRPVFE
ncbi:MAG: hypothetical protein FP816_18540 [Desulfobacteraceae bacterium]|nr:hypothetical protein [Desulfobacteraceae bacterium]